MLLDTAISAGFPSTGPPGPSSFTLQDDFFFQLHVYNLLLVEEKMFYVSNIVSDI